MAACKLSCWNSLPLVFLCVVSFPASSLFIIERPVVLTDGFGNLLYDTMGFGSANQPSVMSASPGSSCCVAQPFSYMKAVAHGRICRLELSLQPRHYEHRMHSLFYCYLERGCGTEGGERGDISKEALE